MEENRWVTGAGWISDESDFYGEDDIVQKLEKTAGPHPRNKNRPKLKTEQESLIKAESASPTEGGVEAGTHNTDESETNNTSLARQAESINAPATFPDTNCNADGDLPSNGHFKDNPTAWQVDESVADFLHRAPVAGSMSASLGPWLWVENPNRKERKEGRTSTSLFTRLGKDLLENFQKERASLEKKYPDQSPIAILRKLRPQRDLLEEEILKLALDTGTICGKWMVFSSPHRVAHIWQLVAEATAQGRLGPVSKVATSSNSAERNARLVCIYSDDFSDLQDVRRVLKELVQMGIVQSGNDAQPIYYKCDAYTYLDINSNNAHDVRASLFSSQDFMRDTKKLEESPVGRMQTSRA